ncbi:hypothetical protein BB558_003411 [Smittium angustum]|uniref:Globin-sensor domain-containing protein n=1 Tax=Smittium angustum TaxID=133377 RepID=A0A2U1J637_SMIAN|nr:hypothetical protein BB558_003411 [Smittium angustum]
MEYISSFIEFGEADHKKMLKSKDLLLPFLDVITDVVYSRMFAYDVTKVNFTHQQDGYKGQIERDINNLKSDDSVIQFRKMMLHKYLRRIVSTEWNIGLIKYLNWTGEIHSNTMLKKSSNDVEYIHLNAMIGFISTSILDIVAHASEGVWDEEMRNEAMVAFSKFFWVQNDFISKSHTTKYDDYDPAENSKALTRLEGETVNKYLKRDSLALSIGGAFASFGIGVFLTTAIISFFD